MVLEFVMEEWSITELHFQLLVQRAKSVQRRYPGRVE
jgi:hypothetical protein